MAFKLDMENSTRAHYVRSLVLAIAVSFALAGGIASVGKPGEDANPIFTREAETLRRELVRPCIDYRVSDLDSALEDKAKADINEVFGGKVDHVATCSFILGID